LGASKPEVSLHLKISKELTEAVIRGTDMPIIRLLAWERYFNKKCCHVSVLIFVRFVYRSFVRLRVPYSSCVSFRSFVRVSCVFRIVRVKRSFVFRSFRLRLVRIVILYDPGSVAGTVFFLTTRIYSRVKVRFTSLNN
jgi:hypothetical protein